MTLLNDKIINMNINELIILFIGLYLFWFIFNHFIFPISEKLIYIIFIFYLFFRLKSYSSEFFQDILNIFSKVSFKQVLMLVLLNILFSYGMLYLANYLSYFSFMNFAFKSTFFGVLTTIIISPVAEELIFRGIFLNKLNLVMPISYAIILSSLMFGFLHSYGNIFSAIIFACCMSIIYLKSGNIFIPIFAHFLNNLFAEIIVFADKNNVLFTNYGVMFVIGCLSVISFCLIIYYINCQLKLINKEFKRGY